MKNLFEALLVISLITASASAQSNKIVFGPLEGDDAGVLIVRNGENIEIEMWVRTDPENPTSIVALAHTLLSEDAIIADRNGVILDPTFDEPNWEQVWLDTYVHDPDDPFPIPEGYTCEMLIALWGFSNRPVEPLNTFGEWVYYGSFLMTCATDIHVDETYYPFSAGWFPHSGQGTSWSFEAPPGGGVVPEQSYCGLYFESETSIDENESLPLEFSLAQNYPNPFNASTTIKYSLPEESDVTIEIYDIMGRKIETLISGIQPAGSHSIVWDAENQPSGVYFYRIIAGEHIESKSCLLLK